MGEARGCSTNTVVIHLVLLSENIFAAPASSNDLEALERFTLNLSPFNIQCLPPKSNLVQVQHGMLQYKNMQIEMINPSKEAPNPLWPLGALLKNVSYSRVMMIRYNKTEKGNNRHMQFDTYING